jgi:hypothetical protein
MRNLILFFFCIVWISGCAIAEKDNPLPRIIVSTDIGGSDPDDYQSMIHLLVYSDQFNIEGIISSPPHQGRKKHIEEVLNAYEMDYENLLHHSKEFPSPDYLRTITKQGAIDPQAGGLPRELSEGAKWVIKKAHEQSDRPLYVLVWGSITDVAQAICADPGIKEQIRIYSIGSWNTVQDPLARDYLYHHHPDLWWIENNTTFRGMYMGGYSEDSYGNLSFVEHHVKDYGELGKLFWEKKGEIKMGDTPSVLYFLDGDINDPAGESWGGSFQKTSHGASYWTDIKEDSLIENGKYGAKTVNRFRQEYLTDWASRMTWTVSD